MSLIVFGCPSTTNSKSSSRRLVTAAPRASRTVVGTGTSASSRHNRAAVKPELNDLREGLKHYPMSMDAGTKNLLKAWHAGVMLVTGSDAGNFLVLHGPTVQHEIELWVAAGIPVEVALQAATLNSAKLLRADSRIGTIEQGKEATLLIVDGNPLQDVKALSGVSTVFLKGERINRATLLQDK